MSAAVPQLLGRWPLYTEIVRENSMYVSKHSYYNVIALHNLERNPW